MARPRSRIADYAFYLAFRVLVCFVQALPWQPARALAAGLAWLAYHVDRRRRRVALENLRHAYPHWSTAEHELLAQRSYLHLALLVLEILHMPRRLWLHNWERHIEFEDARSKCEMLRLFLSGRSTLMVTGHVGNWELSSYLVGLLGFRSHAIARPLDNPWVESFVYRLRQRTGQTILAKKGDFDRIEGVLQEGGLLGTLADQDGGSGGVYVNFFGRLASTHKAVALLALQHNVPLLVTGVGRIGEPLRYRVFLEDLIYPEEYADRPDAVQAITQRFTSALERFVRRFPEQYFWVHRRWKHQPKARVKKKAA